MTRQVEAAEVGTGEEAGAEVGRAAYAVVVGEDTAAEAAAEGRTQVAVVTSTANGASQAAEAEQMGTESRTLSCSEEVIDIIGSTRAIYMFAFAVRVFVSSSAVVAVIAFAFAVL